MKKIAIIGATGNVGRKITELLLERKSINPESLELFASSKSAGKILYFGNQSYTVKSCDECNFSECKLALFATNSDISRQFVPIAIQAGCRVIDSSSAYRLDNEVPLVVAPVNGDLVTDQCSLYAVANCLAAPISVVLKPLHEKWHAKRVTLSTYQSTSGAGKEPMDELYQKTQEVLNGKAPSSNHFARPIPFNVIPQVDKFLDDGFSYEEEFKIIREVQKIVSPEIKIMATSVRVPVGIGHSISLSIEFTHPFELVDVKQVLAKSPGVALSPNHYITPLEVTGSDLVHVGRIRKDPTVPYGLALWTVSDNLRRGAALDAVEVAEKMFSYP